MPSNKLLSPSKFFGEERYQKYLDEITSQGTIEGEQLTSEERKEAFKKRGDKISFETFVDKILARKRGAEISGGPTALPGKGGAIIKRVNIPTQDFAKSPVSEKTQENLDDIMKGIDSILETLRADQKVKEDTQKFEKKQKEKAKREKKEEKLESKAFKGLGKTINKIIKPVKSLFEKLFDFLKTVLLGRVLVKLVDWYTDEKNKGKVDAIGRFLKDTWPALAVGVLAFGTGIGRLITRLTFMIGKWTFKLVRFVIPKLVSFIAKHPFATAAIAAGVGAYAASQLNEANREKENEQDDTSTITPAETKATGKTPGPAQLQREQVLQRGMGGMFAGGGQVPGSGNRDTVPAMLTPGEFVMSKGAVNAFGVDTLASMNAAGGGTNKPKYFNGSMFAQGGGYVEKKEGLSPKLKKEMKERSGDEKVSGGGGRKWWDFLGWAGTDKKKEETSTKGVKGGTGLTDIQKQALGILAKYESGAAGYNAVNQIGTAGGRGVKGFSGDIRKMSQHKGRPLTDFTIAEIKALQFDDKSMSDDQWIKAGKLHAVGKYQFIGNTLPGVAKRAGIPDNAKFSEGAQDLMALQLMKERGISPWVGPSDKATAAERAIIAQARGQDIKFDPSMPTGSMIAAAPSMQPGGGSTPSAPSAPPTPKTSLANLQKAIDFKPAKSAPSIGLPVQRMNANIDALRAAIDGASAPQTSSTSKALNNEIPNISAAIMQSPSKVKTLGVMG